MATLTITVTTAQADKGKWAVGRDQDLKNEDESPRNATAPEVEAWILQKLKGTYHDQERRFRHEVSDATADPF
jgi:hypothetical protein